VRQLLANEQAMLAGEVKALHQMRIALRRLRAVLSVFSEVVSDRNSLRVKSELRWIATAPGRT
jgi:CHAD domain-containing protein